MRRRSWWGYVLWLSVGFVLGSILVRAATGDMVRFTHTKPENVAEWLVVVGSTEYPVTNVQTATDGTMRGEFGPIVVQMVAIGHDGLRSTVSVESNLARVSLACRGDLNDDGAVGADDVGHELTMMKLVTVCQ